MSNPLLVTSGLPQFDAIEPQHAVPALEELISVHRRKLAALLGDTNARDFESLVAPLEEMSHELGRVWSPISHLHSVLGGAAWRDAYNAALPLMTRHCTEMSQNKDLQQAYEQVQASLPADATAAMRKLVEQELRDFRLSGVALPDDQKARYREIRQQIAALQAAFEQHVQDATDHWHFHATRESDVAGIPATIRRRAREDAREGLAEQGLQ